MARGEPHRGGSGAAGLESISATLSALRRVVWGVHVVRLDSATIPAGRPLPELAELQAGLDEALSVLAAELREADHDSFPRLRRLHRELAREQPQLLSHALWAALDELVDATDTAAATVGLAAA